jgi:hypothetical protein
LKCYVALTLFVRARVARVSIALVAAAMTAGNGRRVPSWAFVIHRIRFLAIGTGRLPPAPKFVSMWKPLMAAVLLAVTLTACQDPKPQDTLLITAAGNVKLLSSHFVSTNEAAIGLSGGSITYVLATVELTNDTNQAIYPQMNRFYLLDAQSRHITATDSGSSVFVGISNDLRALKPGEKRQFTVGFRSDASASGTILYDYT